VILPGTEKHERYSPIFQFSLFFGHRDLAAVLPGGLGSSAGVVADLLIDASWKSLLPSSSDNTIDMVTKELIQKEIESFPEPYLAEILDFIHFLRARALKDKSETAILNGSVLARDWLSAEEDRTWKDL